MRSLVIVIVGLLAGAPAPTEPSAQHAAGDVRLVVSVVGLERDEGLIRIAVFDSADRFPDEPILGEVVEPRKLGAEWSASLPRGTYAVAVVHDVDGNGKLNTNLLGMPREPYGFSNDARGTFGAPSFEDAGFVADQRETRVTVRVH
jgi:uncharacterized protein (DUF2141 family)